MPEFSGPTPRSDATRGIASSSGGQRAFADLRTPQQFSTPNGERAWLLPGNRPDRLGHSIVDDSPSADQASKRGSSTHGGGLPTTIQAGVETLSGISMDDVTVHYDSPRPAVLGALAYASGSEIFLGPGQERHLPHEAWHVAQQSRGRIEPTMYSRGSAINANERLEREADVMGARATRTAPHDHWAFQSLLARAVKPGTENSLQEQHQQRSKLRRTPYTNISTSVQRMNRRVRPGNIVQRVREDNPFAMAASHGGWELTAHHIIGHTKLKDALKALDAEQKEDVYTRSIPATLTVSMLNNLRVKVPQDAKDDDLKKFLKGIRDRLVDPTDNGSEGGIALDNIRASFFEWQHGNQFSGPNTSIRTEPTKEKSDLDVDAKYFSVGFDELRTEGELLYDELQARDELLPDDKQGRAANADLVYDSLKKILAITVEKSNADFDPAQWGEIRSLAVLEGLAANKELNRPHMLNYAFFVIPIAETHAREMVGKAKYDMLEAPNYEQPKFTYCGIEIKAEAKGANIFIPIVDSKMRIPQTMDTKPFGDMLGDLGIRPEADGARVKLIIDKKKVGHNDEKGKKLTIKGFKRQIPYLDRSDDDGFILSKEQLATPLPVVAPGKSLYVYLQEKRAPVSSYLPKALYPEEAATDSVVEQAAPDSVVEQAAPDSVVEPAAPDSVVEPAAPDPLVSLLNKALVNEQKYKKEMNRLAGIKRPTPKERKRASLFKKKRDRALESQAKYRR